MRNNQAIAYAINVQDQTVTATVRGRDSITVYLANVSAENQLYAALHGIKQRVGDMGAVLRQDPKTGVILSDAEMDDLRYKRMSAIAAHLNSGATEWDQPRGDGGERDTSGLTIAGIMRALGCTEADANRKVDALAAKYGIERKAALARIAANKFVITAIAEIKAERAERAGAKVDLDELMGA